ncbi:MAG: GNAT family N-acetyltransferase [Acidobacteriota bacterium]
MQVRQANCGDIESLKDLFRAAIAWQTRRGVSTFGEFTDSFLKGEIERGAVFLAVNEEAVGGTISLYESDEIIWGDDHDSALYIHRLASIRTERGRGVGAELVNWSRLRAEAMGKKWLRVDCWADNTDLCQFYLRQGFDVVKVKDTGAHPSLPPHYHHIQLRLFQMPAANDPAQETVR